MSCFHIPSRIVLTVLVVLWPALASALWPHDPRDALVVCNASAAQNGPRIATDGAGASVIVWTDGRSDSRIYAQRVSSDGTPLWHTGGFRVCNVTSLQNDAWVAIAPNGDAVVAWVDSRNGSSRSIYAQRLTATGEHLWPNSGLCVANSDSILSAPVVVVDHEGNAIVLWQRHYQDDWTAGEFIFAQRLDLEGRFLWPTSVHCGGGYPHHDQIVSDGAGGAIVMCASESGAGYDSATVWKLTQNGTLAWGSAGVYVGNGTWLDPVLCDDGAGGCIVAWTYTNWGLYYGVDAQRVSASGTLLWGYGVNVFGQESTVSEPAVMADRSHGAVVSWCDSRPGAAGIYAQRLTANGATSWSTTGVPLCAGNHTTQRAVLNPDGSGGAVAVWRELRSGEYDIYAQRIEAAGNTAWNALGVPITINPAEADELAAASDDAGGVVVTWTDDREGTDDVYACRINEFGTYGALEPSLLQVTDVRPDEGGWVNLRWYGSALDAVPDQAVDAYSIERRVEGTDTWVPVASVEPSGQDYYTEPAPTAADSLPGLIPWQTYRVVAVPAAPGVRYASAPRAGYSADNLAPAAPVDFAAIGGSGGIELAWQPSPSPDVALYRLHRGTTVDFVPAPGNLVIEQATCGYVDAAGTAGSFYKLLAVDIHGNAGPWVVAVPDLTAIPAGATAPTRLNHVVPNPANPQTTVSFDLAMPGSVSLQVFDLRGRLVRNLLDGVCAAGTHRVTWDGLTDAGHAVSSGVYAVRLATSSITATKEISLVR